jgi:uncharacterized protein YxjI
MEIFDPNNQEIVGYFRSKFLTIPKKYWLTDPDDKPIIGIEKHILTFMTKFDFYEAGLGGIEEDFTTNPFLGTLEKKFSLFTSEYDYVSPSGDIRYKVYGNFLGREFTVQQNENVVAKISHKFWTWRNTYGMQIDRNIADLEAMILLTIVVVLDFIADQQQHNAAMM